MNLSRPLPHALSALAILFFSGAGAQAQTPSAEGEYRALMKERKFVETEALARERLAANEKDDVALWFLARVGGGDAKKREELITRTEQCTKVLPQSARCHDALGMLYGMAAASGGMSAIFKYASRVKEEFQRAVELDPKFFDGRRDLNQFYLQAPGIAGGSVRKAIENAEAVAQIDANRGALLRAEVHIYEKEFDKAEAILNGIKPGSDAIVADTLPQIWSSLGYMLMNEKDFPRSQKVFERLVAVDVNNAAAHMGLGRAQLERKLVDEAIASLERAVRISEKIGAHYRLGIAYQTKGEKQKAISAYEKFLTYQATGKAADDIRSRLEELKRG